MREESEMVEVQGEGRPVAGELSTPQLIGRIFRESGDLVRKEIQLAKLELRANLKTEVTSAIGLAVAGALAFLGITMLFVAAAFALANVMPGWAASLIIAGVLLAAGGIAAAIAWGRRVRTPLAHTRENLARDVRLAKERLS